MATELDLGTYLDDDSLLLHNVPSRKHPTGKTYRVPSLSAKDGVKLQKMLSDGASSSDPADLSSQQAKVIDAFCGVDSKGEPVQLAEKLLGPVYREMLDDDVSSERLNQVTTVVWIAFAQGGEIASRVIAGEAAARANRATRRATKATAKKTAGSKSTRASTPTPARTRSSQAQTRTAGRSSTSPTARGARKAG